MDKKVERIKVRRGLKWNEVSDVEHMWEGAKEVVVTNTREVPLLWLGERT